MTDGKWVFDRAIELMDEQDAVSGETNHSDTREYWLRSLGILNVLRHELYPYSDTYEAGADCPELTSMEQVLALDDVLAQSVMPYGLAAHLLLGDRDEEADFFQQRYRELLYGLGSRRMAVWETIGEEA